MGKYLKLFETHSQYTAFTQTEDFILPNVSYCKDQTDIVHYNPLVPPPPKARLYNGNSLLYEYDIYFATECEYDYQLPGYGECESFCCPINFNTWDDNTQQYLPFDSFELVMPGCTDVTVEISNREAQFTYSVTNDTVRVESTEGPWNGFYSFGVYYTCNGLNCSSLPTINYPD